MKGVYIVYEDEGYPCNWPVKYPVIMWLYTYICLFICVGSVGSEGERGGGGDGDESQFCRGNCPEASLGVCRPLRPLQGQVFASCLVLIDTCMYLQDKVVDFMHKLTAHSEQKLRFLCFRLDFNEFYSSSSSELRSTSFIRKMK